MKIKRSLPFQNRFARWRFSIAALVIAGMGLAAIPALSDTTPELANLDKLDPLKAAFSKANGKVRLITLLSPT